MSPIHNPTAGHYGLKDLNHAKALANRVCDVLGHGNTGAAYDLILETACAETQMGQFPDNFEAEGVGLTQFDTIGFTDVRDRTREHNIGAVREAFGYEIRECEITDLAEDPLLALIFTRLKFKLRPEKIPSDFISRAAYWKRFYNTEAGKGTVEHYMESAERILYPEEI